MGNTGQALSNLTQPYLASAIGTYFDKLEEDPVTHQIVHQADTTAERLLAHAAAGAVVAYFSGNNAASGATGAVSGEAMAMLVHDQLYGNKPTDQLTTAEKESIRAVATLASGLAGALQGGSFETAATSAAAGYNAAVNNDLKRTQEQQARTELTAACSSSGQFVLSSGCLNSYYKWQNISADQNLGKHASKEVWDQFAAEADRIFAPAKQACKGNATCISYVSQEQMNAIVSAFPFVNGNVFDMNFTTGGGSLEERAKALKIVIDSKQGNVASLVGSATLDVLSVGGMGYGSALLGGAQKLGGTIKAAIPWGFPIGAQGSVWEQVVTKFLPQGSMDLNAIKSNFAAFDNYVPATREAISAKTLNTVTANSNPAQITNTLNGYVRQMANFTGDGAGGFYLYPEMITSRTMQLAVPNGTNFAQWQAIQKSVQYAQNLGVNIVITKIK